jgi:class 3 adenylate cyclase/chaperonin cofactor prefoldin
MAEENLALVMTDLENSTAGWDRNSRAMKELVESYIDLVEKRLQPPPRVEGFLGDGHLLSFRTVDVAITASLRLRELWDKRRSSFEKPNKKVDKKLANLPPPLLSELKFTSDEKHRLKIAIHTGKVERLPDGRIIGNHINMCARVIGETRPGEILVSEFVMFDLREQDRYAWGEPRSVVLRGFKTLHKSPPLTPIYPLLGLDGEPGEVELPDEAQLRLRRIVQDMWNEITALWGTEEEGTEKELHLARNIIELKPDDSPAHFSLGVVFYRMGRKEEAEKELREAIRLTPNVAFFHNKLGTLLYEKGQKDEAEKELREAIRINPLNFYAHRGLGNLLKSVGRSEEAEAEYKNANELESR